MCLAEARPKIHPSSGPMLNQSGRITAKGVTKILELLAKAVGVIPVETPEGTATEKEDYLAMVVDLVTMVAGVANKGRIRNIREA